MHRMIVFLGGLIFLNVLAAPVAAQSPEVLREFFRSGDLARKVRVLETAHRGDLEPHAALFHETIRYAISGIPQHQSEQRFRTLIVLAADGLRRTNHADAAIDLWQLFEDFQNQETRSAIMSALEQVGADNPRVVRDMADWLRRQHGVYAAGGRPDVQVVAMTIRAIGAFESPVAFPVLVEAALLKYPDYVTDLALDGITRIPGDRQAMAATFLTFQPVTERSRGLSFFLASDLLSDEEKLQLASDALDTFAHRRNLSSLETQEYRNIRMIAADAVAAAGYGDATFGMIRHFEQSALDYERGLIFSHDLITAIHTLGAMPTEAAVRRLSDYLTLLNVRSSGGSHMDPQVLLATIEALKNSDSPVAQDALLFATMMENYPARVRQAAVRDMTMIVQ